MAHVIPTFDLNTAVVPVPFQLTWANVRTLLKVCQNFRFCTSLAAAQAMIQGQPPPPGNNWDGKDFIAFMGGFSHVVGRAVPAKAMADFEGKKQVHQRLELAIDNHVYARNQRNAASWAGIAAIWDAVDTTPQANSRVAFTAAEKITITQAVQAQLLVFITALSNEPNVWVVFLKAFDMISMDQDRYGDFGKSGPKQLNAQDFDNTEIVTSAGQQGAVPNVPTRLLWAFLRHAQNVEATLGY